MTMQNRVFVGREGELAELQGYLEQTLASSGQICFVSGQAGSGKTALVRTFAHRAIGQHPEVVIAMGTCNAQTGIGDPYLPFRDALAMLTDGLTAQQAAGRLSPENSTRLRTILARSVQVLVEVAPELIGAFIPGAKLLGYFGEAVAKWVGWMDRLDDLAKRAEKETGTAEAAADQSRIFEQYTAFLQKLSEQVPLILFLDDLQWADSASINLLFHLGRHLEESRVLILGAYRPDDVALGRNGERHPLGPVLHELTRYYGDVTIDLDAIPEEQGRRFVDALLDAESNCLDDQFRHDLYHQTGGHALFTVELLQAMIERGDLQRDAEGCWIEGPSLDWGALPARVEGVIQERVDRLSPALREMLQVASVQGEEFSAEVLARVQKVEDRKVIWQLSRELQGRHRLLNAEGLLQVGRVRLSRYRFSHNLFQHYLYHSLGEAERFYLHRDVGRVLETLFEGQTEEVAALLAHHFEQAGLAEEAAVYRLQAGNRARRMSAHREAAAHLGRGLEQVASLPAGTRQMQLELDLQVSLGTALIALYGYASPRVDQVFARARELCHALGNPPQVINVLLAEAVFYLMRGDVDRARKEAEEVLRLAQASGQSGFLLTAHLMLGVAALYAGSHDEARQHLEQVTVLYDPVQHRDLAYQQGQDPGVRAHSFLARVLWLQGFPREAMARQREASELAERLEHPYSATVTALHASTLYAMLRQWPQCEATATRASQLARQGGFKMWEANAEILHGLSLAHRGRAEEGLDELVQGLYLWEATGAGLVAHGRSALAEVFGLAGRRLDGLRAVDEALYPGDEDWWLPELYRLKAELLLLAPGAEEEAEALLRQAADLARSQGARSLELRAVTGLARLMAGRSDGVQARELLARSYAWFDADLDLPDLRDARDFLEQLEGAETYV
ncbi:MAG: ATP-binding protein [Anaerolineae bacterium]